MMIIYCVLNLSTGTGIELYSIFQDSHAFLSKHFGPSPKEENLLLYSTESNWSDTVRKAKKTSDTGQGQSSEFTKLKDNEMKSDHSRTGFGGITDRNDKWTRGQDEKSSQKTNENRVLPTENCGGQVSWKRLLANHRFGTPGKMSTVEENDDSDTAGFVDQRPKHLINRIHIEDGSAKVMLTFLLKLMECKGDANFSVKTNQSIYLDHCEIVLIFT
jgi:hypothetical protein